MKTKCPLCLSKNINILEEIKSKDVVNLYKRSLGIDVEHLFKKKSFNKAKCNKCGLIFFIPEIIGDERFYENLQKFDWYYAQDKKEFELATKYIKNNDRVLEIGCGDGNFAKKIKTEKYLGLEFNDRAIKKARQKGINVKKESIEKFSKENNELYDVVCNFQVLEHISNPYSFLKSSIMCLKKGGIMIISVPSESSFMSLAINNILNIPPHHTTRWTDAALLNIGKMFNDIKVECIYHERVANVHKSWFFNTLGYNTIRNIFRRKIKTIDIGIIHKYLAILNIPLKKIISYNKELPDCSFGHTITVILRKK